MKSVSNRRGQVLVEYLLLMVIAIGCATIMTKKLVDRGTSPGIIIKNWNSVLKNLANDVPDCAKQIDYNSANCPP